MPFQLQGGNPTTNDYDYTSGSGFDSFISRSLDEISWQSQGLGTVYNTLSNLPIGTSPTTATPTNYDQTQISGSQSNSTTLGGSTGGSAVGGPAAGAGIIIQSGSNNIEVNDGTNNRAIFGYNPTTNTWGIFATPPGIDIGNANNAQQLSLSTDFSQMIVALSGSYTIPSFTGQINTFYYVTATIPHNQPSPPAYLIYSEVTGGTPATQPVLGLPNTYFTNIITGTEYYDALNTLYAWNVGVDATNLYITLQFLNNEAAAPWTTYNVNVTFYILGQTAKSTNTNPNINIVGPTIFTL